jgi:hypothetical protein
MCDAACLQELGIKRQDHAQRIAAHLTSVYAPELHMQLEAAAAARRAEGVEPGPAITFCVEGNISAGKSTFLGYITNNNQELQEALGVSRRDRAALHSLRAVKCSLVDYAQHICRGGLQLGSTVGELRMLYHLKNFCLSTFLYLHSSDAVGGCSTVGL